MSVFSITMRMSDALCDFLGVPHGTCMSRIQVTHFIVVYIKEHKLYNPENKRIIHHDEKLRTLLNIKSDQELTIFSLQPYLTPLFI